MSILTPTAITMPANLAGIVGDIERACELLQGTDPVVIKGSADPNFREQLANTAEALFEITERASAALGFLARCGVRPASIDQAVRQAHQMEKCQ